MSKVNHARFYMELSGSQAALAKLHTENANEIVENAEVPIPMAWSNFQRVLLKWQNC
jgi:hypothetical protein